MIKILTTLIGLVLFAFASLTFYLSTSIIFDLFNVRASQGNYVLFVVITNFVCSFLYFFAVYGFFKKRNWTFSILGLSLLILLLVFSYFNIYTNTGGTYEAKTYGALLFRITVTAVFTFLAYLLIAKKKVSL